MAEYGKEGLGVMYRLTANKTKFYTLAKRYFPELGPMREAKFIKYPRSRDYGLEFRAGECWHSLFLSVCGGRARLGDACTAYTEDGERVSDWEVRTLELAELQKLGMLEDVPVRAPG